MHTHAMNHGIRWVEKGKRVALVQFVLHIPSLFMVNKRASWGRKATNTQWNGNYISQCVYAAYSSGLELNLFRRAGPLLIYSFSPTPPLMRVIYSIVI